MSSGKEMVFDVFDISGKKIEDLKIESDIFNTKINNHAVLRSVNVYNANKRQATAKTKNRSEVRGGGKKPWRQKGTGRARAGSIRSPIFRGGGVVFGPRGNQNYKIKQNKKEYTLALKSALVDKINEGKIIVIKEKEINIQKKEKILFVVNEFNKKTELSFRNISNLKLIIINNINVFDILNCNYLFITDEALKNIVNKYK